MAWKVKRSFAKVKCQNIDSPVAISIMNDSYWISAGWLAGLPACLVIVSATDYRDGVFIALWR